MDDNDRTGKKGFAGLDSMVSDVKVPKAPAPEPVRREEIAGDPEPVIPSTQPAYTGNNSSGGSSGKWWAIGIGLVVFFLWIGSSDKHTSSNIAPAPAPEAAAPAPIYEPSSPGSSREEERPPIGSGLVFNRSQIRYCLSEKIRISAWENQVDQYSETSVNAFNEAVNDYNSRCSHFRYRSGAVQSVQSEVEAIRYSLQLQGIARAHANP